MLDEARRRHERGTDVVIAVIDHHDRPQVAALAHGPEVVGPGGVEMDVEAVLARRPEVAVVDDLAHANPSGSRNATRWQDVEELVGAGIEVLSTVSIQHVESLSDVVAEIVG